MVYRACYVNLATSNCRLVTGDKAENGSQVEKISAVYSYVMLLVTLRVEPQVDDGLMNPFVKWKCEMICCSS